MAKKLLASKYRISIAENAVYLPGNILHQRLLLITDVTLNRIIYNFADSASGLVTIDYNNDTEETKIVFVQSLSLLEVEETDVLQVLVENEAVEIRPEDPFLDPVSKLRVSNPENLIDTDFEYGLQSTKWETLKLVNNVPSFYSKATAEAFDIISVQSTQFSNSVVVTANEHGLTIGTPFELTGLTDSQYEGGYIVSSVPDINTFTFDIPFAAISSQELKTVYTNILTGAFYFGSQISVLDVLTDGLPNSTIKVKTRFLHGFTLDTPFYFLNTVAVFRQDIPYENIQFANTVVNEKSLGSLTVGENLDDWRQRAITPFEYIPATEIKYFDSAAYAGPGRHDNLVHEWLYDRMSPIESVEVTSGGAGYNFPPYAYATQRYGWGVDRRVPHNPNSTQLGNIFNNDLSTCQRDDGTWGNWLHRMYPNGDVYSHSGAFYFYAYEWKNGANRTAYWAGERPTQFIMARENNTDPFANQSSPIPFPWERVITNTDRQVYGWTNTVTDPNADGYSPVAGGTQVVLQGSGGASIAANEQTATMLVNVSNLQGQLVAGQEIRVFNSADEVVLLDKGCYVSSVSSPNGQGEITVTIQMPKTHNGFSGTLSGYFYSAMWNTTEDAFYVKNHGMETGDFVYYWTDSSWDEWWKAKTENQNATNVDNGTTEHKRVFSVIKVDNDWFKLSWFTISAEANYPMGLDHIGKPVFANGLLTLPRHMFIQQGEVWARSRTVADDAGARWVRLYPTFEDGKNRTNAYTFPQIDGTTYLLDYHMWVRQAKLSAEIRNNQLSAVNVVHGGDLFYGQGQVNAAQTQIQPFKIVKGLAAAAVSGTNTFTLRQFPGDTPIIVGMLVRLQNGASGIPAGAVVTGISAADSNGFFNVTISGNTTAAIGLGEQVHFVDNVQVQAQAFSHLLSNTLYIPDHGLNYGDAIKFEGPPGENWNLYNTTYSLYNNTYWVSPASKDRLTICREYTTAGTFPTESAVRNQMLIPSYSGSFFTYDGTFKYAYSKVVPIATTSSGTEFRFAENITQAPWNFKVGDVLLQTSDWNGDSYWTGLTAARRTIRVDQWWDSRYFYPFYITAISPDGRGISVSTSASGSFSSVGSQTSGTVFFRKIDLIPEANSIYITGHGFENDEYVVYNADGAAISGLSAQAGANGYLIDKVSEDRFRLKDRVSKTIKDIYDVGNSITHTFRNEKYNLLGNTIFKEKHGFAPKDRITYDPNNNPIIDGLVSNGEYTLRKVSDDYFRLSRYETAQELDIVDIRKTSTSSSVTIRFGKNHGYSVGDKIIIRDCSNQYMNTFWEVASVPTSPTYAGAPSSITCFVPEFVNPVETVDLRASAGVTYGVAYRYISFDPVTANDVVITPAKEGDVFVYIDAFDVGLSNKTALSDGGGLVNEQIVVKSDILPLGSTIESTQGTGIVNAKIRFKQATITTISRDSNVVTVTTEAPHGYDDQQTVVITGVTTTSFNTSTPVVITNVDANTFTFAQNGSNETDSDGGTITLALTAAQAAKFNANGNDERYTYLNNTYDTFRQATDFDNADGRYYGATTVESPSLASGVSADQGAEFIYWTSNITQIPSAVISTVAPVYVGQYVLPLATVEGLRPGMPIFGAYLRGSATSTERSNNGYNYTPYTKITRVDPVNNLVFVDQPITANQNSNWNVTVRLITPGMEVIDDPQATVVTASATNAGDSTIEMTLHDTNVANNLYVSATTAVSTATQNELPDTNQFTLNTLSNVFSIPRYVQNSWQSTNPYVSPAPYQSGATDWSNVRGFSSASIDPALDDIDPGTDVLRIADHPWQTGDAVRYNANGGAPVGGLTSSNTYYVIRVDEDTIRLAASENDANTNQYIDITSNGTGAGHYLFGNVYFGTTISSNTGNYTGTIAEGMGISCITTNATGAIPVGARVIRIVDNGAGVSQNYYRYSVKISTTDNSLVTSQVGAVDTNGNETRMQVRAGTYSNGTTFYSSTVSGVQVGMMIRELFDGDGTIANGTLVTAVDNVNNTFEVNNQPTIQIRAGRIVAGSGTADTAFPARIFTDNLTGLEVGMVIAQRNASGASANPTDIANGRPLVGSMVSPTTTTSTPYFVTAIGPNYFDLNKNPGSNVFLGDLVAGTFSASNDSSYMYVQNNIGANLQINHTVVQSATESDETGTLNGGTIYTIRDIAAPASVGGPYRIRLNANVSVQFRGGGTSYGVRSVNEQIYVPDASGINTGMVLTLTGGTGQLRGNVTVTAVQPNGTYDAAVTNGITGDYITVTTDDPSGDPFVTDLTDASLEGELANAIAIGSFVFSDQRNFPQGAQVTAVDTNTNTVTISQNHGGIDAGESFEFSPFDGNTHVVGASTASDFTITLSKPHGGVLGGTPISFRKLPRGSRIGGFNKYIYASWFLIRVYPPQPFNAPVSSTTTTTATGGRRNVPITLRGSNKNLNTNHSFDSFGTHIFTRSSNADGVYQVIDTQPTEFTVGSTSFIPNQTKTFSNLDVDLNNDWFKINNHKFRDGTPLVYRAGSQDPIGIEYPYAEQDSGTVDDNGDPIFEPVIDTDPESPTYNLPLPLTDPATNAPYKAFLEDGETYYAVLIDPNYFYLTYTFDEAREETPRIIALRSNTNGAQSFDTFSLQGYTIGEGRIRLNEDSGIIGGNGTKFLTNFKGGDVLRFYTQGQPGRIYKYIIQSVKSNNSMKLTEQVIADRSLILTLGVARTFNAGTTVVQLQANGEYARGVVSLDTENSQELILDDVGGETFSLNRDIATLDNEGVITTLTGVRPTAIENPFNFLPFSRLNDQSTAVATQGDQTIKMRIDTQGITVQDIKPGFLVADSLFAYFEDNTAVISVDESTGFITVDKKLKGTLPAGTTLNFQPTFNYFIETNLYVKSNAVTSHKPFDGGVSMTTGLNPDSIIARQTRKYFRYQSGKGIQCSMAINFNPPTDCEQLTSSENVATIRVDRPHGFKPGTENEIRVTEAEVLNGHNGYNGNFLISEVIDDYNFSYVYEDTPTIGKISNGSAIIENVASFENIEVGKKLKSGVFGPITVDTETVIDSFNEIQKTITLTKPLAGTSETQAWRSISRVNNVITVTTEETLDVEDTNRVLVSFDSPITLTAGTIVQQTRPDTTVARGEVYESVTNATTIHLYDLTGDGVFGTDATIAIVEDDGQGGETITPLGGYIPNLVEATSEIIPTVFGGPHNIERGQWISISGADNSDLDIDNGEVISVGADFFIVESVGLDGAETMVAGGTATITVLNTLTAYRQNGSGIAYGFPKFNLKRWRDASIRAGLFDSQNGMFFEFDGENLNCVRRSSVQQLAGKAIATYRSALLLGVNTRFSTQLAPGDSIVIRGMTYKVIGIESDTGLHIQPEYRGQTLTDIIVTKVVDVKVPQYDWNLDVADGTGRSGYVLDINKIQMVYIDYSWYGAGKIRFGFKNQLGEVVYFHEFIHNNRLVEAYMRSGNIPARYEVETYNNPTFAPALFHWGTSVIMDGRFDADNAYLFTADSNIITLTNGGKLSFTYSFASTQSNARPRRGNNFLWIKLTDAPSFVKGAVIQIQGDRNNSWLSSGTVIEGVDLSQTQKLGTITYVKVYISKNVRNDWWSNTITYELGGGATAVSIDAQLSPIPLVSIRLSPSVDNGLSGGLGFRDIINRMQLTLKSCGVLISHESEVKLYLNADLSDSDFKNNQSPSLSQIHIHQPGETFENGIQLFSFRASGGQKQSTGKRNLVETSEDLGELITLGNSILGGDEVFPNGPDILTIAVKPIDTSSITGTEPFQGSARITWAESQA